MTEHANPELPILDELDREFHRLLERTFHSTMPRRRHKGRSRRQPPVVAPPRRRGRPPIGRVARRALTALALLSLAGATALAGRSVVGDGGGSTGDRPVTIGEAPPGEAGWKLLAHRDGGQDCYTFVIAMTVSTDCGDLAPTGIQVASRVDGGTRFVFGITGRDVARVLVRMKGRRLEKSTSAAADRRELASVGLPSGLRWFVAATRPAPAAPGPVRVMPQAASGQLLGPAVLDCSLGAAASACRRAAAR